jgi:hypothetical protein
MRCDAILPLYDRNGLTDVNTGVSISYDSTRSSSLISEFIRLDDIAEILVASLFNVLLAVTYVGVDGEVSKLSYIVEIDDELVVGIDGIASDDVEERGGGGGGIGNGCCVSSFKLPYEPCKLS